MIRRTILVSEDYGLKVTAFAGKNKNGIFR
jgi:hypothetical protein